MDSLLLVILVRKKVLQFIYVSSKVNCLKLPWTGKNTDERFTHFSLRHFTVNVCDSDVFSGFPGFVVWRQRYIFSCFIFGPEQSKCVSCNKLFNEIIEEEKRLLVSIQFPIHDILYLVNMDTSVVQQVVRSTCPRLQKKKAFR